MNKYIKLFIVVFTAVILANVFSSTLIGFWYKSETDKALELSKKQIEQYQKLNTSNTKSIIERQQNQYLLSSEKLNQKQNIQQYQREQSAYERKLKYEAARERTKQLKEERAKAYEVKREKQKLAREKNKIKQMHRQADREHIRKQNLETCQFWIDAYKNSPTLKNNELRTSSCNRAYGN
jgi:hypothetical protein